MAGSNPKFQQPRSNLAEGAAKSLKKTIGELMVFLGHQGNQPNHDLRDFLDEKLSDLAVRWYRRGFNRGHIESQKQAVGGKVAKTLRYDATRTFWKSGKRTVHLKSVRP